MTLDNLKITTCDDCSIIINEDLLDYLGEDNSDGLKRNFRYSDTVSIDVIVHNKTKESEITKSVVFTKHDSLAPIKVKVGVDGFFSIVHIILPSKEWYDRQKAKNSQVKVQYKYLFYSDGKKIYQGFFNDEDKEVSLDTIVDFNDTLLPESTIFKIEKEYVSICFLRKCYVNLCKQIFEQRTNISCYSKEIDSELIYKRDLVWMAINVIKYLTEREQLYEVERIAEILHGCNGICSSSNKINLENGCGCSR